MGQLPPHDLDPSKLEAGTRLILEGLGVDPTTHDEVVANTPRRVADLYTEMINPAWCDVDEVFKTFEPPEAWRTGDMVMVHDVHYVSMCEHHLAPSFGVAHVAYIPDLKVVGYSKLKKGLNYVARGPQLNERILADTLDIIEKQVEPKGCALVLQSTHCCIALRSSAPSQEVVTVQGFRGDLATDPWRREFTDTLIGRKPLFLGA
jgi:GTP cyclohydrolase I